MSKSLSACIRNKRLYSKKTSDSYSTNTPFENFTIIQNVSIQVQVSISDKIKEKGQDFLESYNEFSQLFTNCSIIREFEIYKNCNDMELKIKKVFYNASKFLKISVNSDLEIFDYIKIYREIERKIYKSSESFLEVNFFIIHAMSIILS